MITIRQAAPEDTEALQNLLQAYGMGEDISSGQCLVAVEENSPAGLVRLEFGAGIPYIRPVAVFPTQQRKGIGTLLLQFVIATYPEVRVVSRGEAAEFYRKLGFQPIAWDEIYKPFRQECEQCPERAECTPCPMVHRDSSSLHASCPVSSQVSGSFSKLT